MKAKNLIVLMVLVFVVNFADAQVQVQKIQASFIANFMRYIKWPEQESIKTFKIGVFGKNQAILSALNSSVNGKNVGLATISVVEVETVDDIKGCQMVFVSRGKSIKAKKEMEMLGATSVLTITEEQDFTPNYAMINFKVKDSKLTFQLNQELARQKNIQVSSRLAQMSTN